MLALGYAGKLYASASVRYEDGAVLGLRWLEKQEGDALLCSRGPNRGKHVLWCFYSRGRRTRAL